MEVGGRERDRHDALIAALREEGAGVRLIRNGDVAPAIAAGQRGTNVDMLYGIGGTPEGVISAAALKCVGGGIEAWTGVGPLGFLDVMVVSEWEPPHRCTVEHVGKFVRGSGGFQVSDLGGGRSRVLWWERVEIPFGAAGRVGWRVVRPLAQWGVLASLKRFRRIVEGR